MSCFWKAVSVLEALRLRSFAPLLFFILVYITVSVRAIEEQSTSAERRAADPLRRSVQQDDRRFFKFLTRPDIDAPLFDITVHNKYALAPGYWFISPYQDLNQVMPGDAWTGPHIYDGNGQLIWSGSPMFGHWNTFDFGVTTMGGKPMMSVLYEHENVGVILDDTYEIYQTVFLGDNTTIDMHDFNVIDDGRKALVLTRTWENTTSEMSAAVGLEGSCYAKYEGFHEIDLLDDGKPVFEWTANRHIGLDECTFNTGRVKDMCRKGWDILHFNSIDKLPDGDYIVSARHTDTIYKISAADGSIVWRLGGRKNDFKMIGDVKFSRQHHSRVIGQNDTHTMLSIFDNAVGTGPEEQPSHDFSRGLVLILHTSGVEQMTATLFKEYPNPNGGTVNSRGSFQILPNGNAFSCWTYSSRISEHASDGSLLMEAGLRVQAHSYRAFKFPWVSHPARPPDVISQAVPIGSAMGTLVYVSWNGATEVVTWHSYHTDRHGTRLELMKTAMKDSFEVSMTWSNVAEYVVVEALDRNGVSIGQSDVIRTLPASKGLVESIKADANDSVFSMSGEAGQAPPEEDGWERLHASNYEESVPVLSHSSMVFALGFMSCGAVGALFWLVLSFAKVRASYRWQLKNGYIPVWQDEARSGQSP